ncbi:MAG: serine/threonine protein kinase [Planctomycetes bacterium]|nr:serine/threonine protein kinase [Planctomycetota bacterium]
MSGDLPDLSSTRLDHYLIERKLGEGGMGAVYLAQDEVLGRQVVIKVMRPELSTQEQFRQRFLREAKAALAFAHTNAIATHSCQVSAEGFLYLVQDYSPGEPLDKVLSREGRFPPERAFDFVRQVLCALREAHGQGILHRDLKPANLLLEIDRAGRDHVKVCDFGLAKLLDEQDGGELTGQHSVLGTPAYMAPEQASGSAADERSDLYQVGVILYEFLVGVRPFAGSTQELLFKQIMAAPPPLDPSFSAGVRQVVARALAKKPADRYASASAFLAAIEELGLDMQGHGIDTARMRRKMKISDLELQAMTSLAEPLRVDNVPSSAPALPPTVGLLPERVARVLALGAIALGVFRGGQVLLAS